jgi:Fis family transcriptional regulator
VANQDGYLALSAESGEAKPLRDLTHEALHAYFENLNGHRPGDLYSLVMSEVEQPLFKVVLEFTGGNQSRAADILGINRGTLRKKLRGYRLID